MGGLGVVYQTHAIAATRDTSPAHNRFRARRCLECLRRLRVARTFDDRRVLPPTLRRSPRYTNPRRTYWSLRSPGGLRDREPHTT